MNKLAQMKANLNVTPEVGISFIPPPCLAKNIDCISIYVARVKPHVR